MEQVLDQHSKPKRSDIRMFSLLIQMLPLLTLFRIGHTLCHSWMICSRSWQKLNPQCLVPARPYRYPRTTSNPRCWQYVYNCLRNQSCLHPPAEGGEEERGSKSAGQECQGWVCPRICLQPCRDSLRPLVRAKIATEAQHGLIAQVLKDILFSSRPGAPTSSSVSVEEVVDTAMSIG